MKEHTNIPILIIAAGNSSRLGRPKQLEVRSDNKRSLIKHVVKEALKSRLGEVLVVLGAYIQEIKQELVDLDCTIIENEHWKKGMSTSIVKGINYLQELDTNGCIISLSDQIYISSNKFIEIASKVQESKKSIIYSKYKSDIGPPIYFSDVHFPELSLLIGDKGAKSFVKKQFTNSSFVNFPKGDFDVDTDGDISLLKEL